MKQYKVIQYVDRVLSAMCTWYIYHSRIVPINPGYRLKRLLKNFSFIFAECGKDRNVEPPREIDEPAIFYVYPPPKSHPQYEEFVRRMVDEHVKAITHPEDVDVIYVVLD